MFGKVKNYLLIVAVVVFVATGTPLLAQSGWKINRDNGKGDLISVFFTSSSKGWVAGDDGYLAQTTDGGRSWRRKILNTAANINEIYFRNDNNGYLVAGRKMFVTADGGNSWREALIAREGQIKEGTPEFLSIRFNSKNQGFIIGSVLNGDEEVIDSLLMRTVDGGRTWSRLLLPDVKTELFHLDFDGKQEGWIVGDMGVILATRDNGNTWIKQNSGTSVGLYNVDFRNDKDGYAVGEEGTILKTEDGGRSWTKVTNYVKRTLFRVNFVDDKNGWIVGSGGTILRTYDKGATWVKQTVSTESNLYGLYMQKKYGWSVGKSGIIIRYER
ncbi:MAG: hypothetical protein HKN33_05225 [Pyrinomonadaceae bacterium]|nr:hypothetical protein [Pyrinomonadaceae bacterium]